MVAEKKPGLETNEKLKENIEDIGFQDLITRTNSFFTLIHPADKHGRQDASFMS
jgi:hypothetical protein